MTNANLDPLSLPLDPVYLTNELNPPQRFRYMTQCFGFATTGDEGKKSFIQASPQDQAARLLPVLAEYQKNHANGVQPQPQPQQQPAQQPQQVLPMTTTGQPMMHQPVGMPMMGGQVQQQQPQVGQPMAPAIGMPMMGGAMQPPAQAAPAQQAPAAMPGMPQMGGMPMGGGMPMIGGGMPAQGGGMPMMGNASTMAAPLPGMSPQGGGMMMPPQQPQAAPPAAMAPAQPQPTLQDIMNVQTRIAEGVETLSKAMMDVLGALNNQGQGNADNTARVTLALLLTLSELLTQNNPWPRDQLISYLSNRLGGGEISSFIAALTPASPQKQGKG